MIDLNKPVNFIQNIINTSGNTNIIPAEQLTLEEGISEPFVIQYEITPSAPAGENDSNECLGTTYIYEEVRKKYGLDKKYLLGFN